MRLGRVALVLSPVPFLIAKVDASANATATPAPSDTFLSTGDRSGTLLSEPPYARDEERVKAFGWGDIADSLVLKYQQPLWEPVFNFMIDLKDTWAGAGSANPNFMYKMLKLHKLDEDILSNIRFHAWVKFVHDYNSEHPERQVSIFGRLWKQYGDYKLSMMLEQAKGSTDPSLRAIATKVQHEQMLYWRHGKVDPSQLYHFLQVDQINPGLLTGRAYNIWNIYSSRFFPGKSMTLFDQLHHLYGDAGLTSLLISARRSGKTVTQATDLQNQLRNAWLNKGVTPKLLFKILRLDKKPNRLLDQPELLVWKWFGTVYWTKTQTDVTLNEVIRSFYDANEIKIIINSATTDHGKILAKELANAHA